MNWGQFKDPGFCLCHIGCVVTSLSITQEITDQIIIFHKIIVTEFNECSENI